MRRTRSEEGEEEKEEGGGRRKKEGYDDECRDKRWIVVNVT